MQSRLKTSKAIAKKRHGDGTISKTKKDIELNLNFSISHFKLN